MVRSVPILAFAIAAFVAAGCGLFAPRTPKAPVAEGGTYIQPDAPDAVVENLKAAVSEMNAVNYRRSLDEDMDFEPTALAKARDPSLWASWSRAEENGYFTTMAEAARQAEGHVLRLEEVTADLSDTRYALDASYVLVVHHRRTGIPDTVQGRLVWEIIQRPDGLWALSRWTDQMLGMSPSWSDIKAEFGK